MDFTDLSADDKAYIRKGKNLWTIAEMALMMAKPAKKVEAYLGELEQLEQRA